MLDLANAGHFAGKMHGKVKFFCFGLDTWAKRSLTLLGAGGGCLRPDVFFSLSVKKIAYTTCYIFRLLFIFLDAV